MSISHNEVEIVVECMHYFDNMTSHVNTEGDTCSTFVYLLKFLFSP